jgi:hypothetical protein
MDTRTKKKVEDLGVKNARAIAGGRKAGGSQQEYMIVKLEDILITGVQPGTTSG